MITERQLEVEKVRAEFPILSQRVHGKPLAYLDNAATAQKPQIVLETMDDYWRNTNANIHRGVHALSQEATARFDRARSIVRSFLNAKHDHEVILTKGCTEGINLVAQSYARNTLKPGDEILLTTMEHHSNIVPWQLVAEQTGAKARIIPINDRVELELDSLADLITDRTKIVACVHISNSIGTVNPIKFIARKAHDAGAIVVVDGAQGGPHAQIDVQDLDADFYTLSCHKIYAPTGVGVLYGKERLLEAMPPYHGGGDMIRTVSFEGSTYAGLPNKFEAGTPNIAGVIGLGAAIEYLTALGPEAHAHENALADAARQKLSEIDGVKIWGEANEKASIVSFTVDSAHPHDIGTVLDSEGIAVRAGHHCCMPLMTRLGIPATARASFAFYNTFEEVDRLVAGVKKIKEMFA